MKLVDIMDKVQAFLIIDETNLSKASLETPKHYAEVLRIRTDENIRLGVLKSALKELYNQKKEYYGGTADPEVYRKYPFDRKLLKSDVERFVEADKDIQNKITQIDIQSEKISYLNDALKMIQNRNFQIKAAIDYQKLIAGGY